MSCQSAAADLLLTMVQFTDQTKQYQTKSTIKQNSPLVNIITVGGSVKQHASFAYVNM